MRNFLEKILNVLRGKSAPAGPPAYVYVYTAGKGSPNSEVNPNDQVAILRRLSLFAGKRNTPVTIIFPGRPTRKIPDGAKQDGVQVRFATAEKLEAIVRQSLAEFERTHAAVLAADRSEFQKLADNRGVGYCLTSTFVKTLDSVCGPIQRESKPQQPRRQPQPPKKEIQASEATMPESTPPEGAGVPAAPTTEVKTSDSLESSESSTEPAVPNPEASSRMKLRRHVPSQKRELTDRAILDLIDPL